MHMVKSFSKLSKEEKLAKVTKERWAEAHSEMEAVLKRFWYQDSTTQELLDSFSENTLSNYPLPFGVAPNFLINGREYIVPMVIEESSVVAAAASAAKFWKERGGISVKIQDTVKVGQLHFEWWGDAQRLESLLPQIKEKLKEDVAALTQNMVKRGGGILDMELVKFPEEPHYYQLRVQFETRDSMGANFINSVLEAMGQSLVGHLESLPGLEEKERKVRILMAILSNYTPHCIGRAEVSCPIEDLGCVNGYEAEEFAYRFCKAVRIAEIDPYRAATHNKGIYNGIDAVVLATGNDFRAVEACGHAYASTGGRYKSLSHCRLEEGRFVFSLEVPLALGTVGGLTTLHPLAKWSMRLLGDPSARELMEIVLAVGLAQNFAAVRSLVTTGIQKGHMKMHLLNILKQMEASQEEIEGASCFFEDQVITYSSVRKFLEHARKEFQ
jgi:hydroxymethylglutaryl-CoA reductase